MKKLRFLLFFLPILTLFAWNSPEKAIFDELEPGVENLDSLIKEAAILHKKLKPLHQKKGRPRKGEWLFEKRESGQSFTQFTKAANPVTTQRCKIYMRLIGTFSASELDVIRYTKEYLEAYFQLPVVLLQPEDDLKKLIPKSARRTNPHGKNEQWNATYILNKVLKKERPDDARAYVGFTSSDLYPKKGWNYVFGLANPFTGCGIWSIHRYGNPADSPEAKQLCTERTVKVASHEIGHLFGLDHCKEFECNMNGSLTLKESDKQVAYLCPDCLSKMSYATHVPVEVRLNGLKTFWNTQQIDTLAAHYSASLNALQK